jgi:hypothetical protein
VVYVNGLATVSTNRSRIYTTRNYDGFLRVASGRAPGQALNSE